MTSAPHWVSVTASSRSLNHLLEHSLDEVSNATFSAVSRERVLGDAQVYNIGASLVLRHGFLGILDG